MSRATTVLMLSAVAALTFATSRNSWAAQPAAGAGPAAPRFVPEDHRPPVFFREDFTNFPQEKPVTPASLINKNLSINTYGPGKDMVEKSHHDSPKDDPSYIWLGSCTQVCAFTLRRNDAYVDLTGLAKIQWRTKQTGFHQLRLLLKLANGDMLVSDYAEGGSSDWRISEFSLADLRWRRMELKYMNDGAWVDKPDLSKVDEIGWIDFAAGSGSGTGGAQGSSRVDWVEVYGVPVAR